MSYEDDIVIDEQSLDCEWLDQPARMARYCELAAEARRQMDLAEERVDFVRAQLDRDVRANPALFGITVGPRGITEDAIKSAIKVNGDYQVVVKSYIDAKYEHEVAVGAVRAFDQRKSALENLVRLHGQSYFAGPSVPRDLPAERARRDREVQRSIRIGENGKDQRARVPRRRS